MTPDFFPREQYYCVLDGQPDFLVPGEALEPFPANGADELIVNPRCWLGWHGPLPAAMAAAAGSGEGLFDFPWTIWVEDPDRGTLWPYWLGPGYAHLLEHLAPGQRYEGDLPPDVVQILRIADILVAPEAATWRRHAWATALESFSYLIGRGYLPLSGLLPPYHVGALRRYYRYHTRIGTFTLGDEQTPGRYVSYDEPVTQFVHRQLTRTIGDITRRIVAPTYSYLAFYQGGATLDPHTDRDACEYTLSLCIDATPDPRTYGAWPLQLLTAEGTLALAQGIGDGLLFRGRELLHWRDQLPDGYTSSSVLFHFVDVDGAQ